MRVNFKDFDSEIIDSFHGKASILSSPMRKKYGELGENIFSTKSLNASLLKQIHTSPNKQLRQVSDTHPLAQQAIEYKKRERITAGRNVAILRYRLDQQERTMIAHTEGMPNVLKHAELRAIDALPKGAKITALYTERMPCGPSCGNCIKKLKIVLPKDVPIFYSVSYPNDLESRRASEQKFRASQKAKGVLLSKN